MSHRRCHVGTPGATYLLETLFPLSLSTTLDFSIVGKAC